MSTLSGHGDGGVEEALPVKRMSLSRPLFESNFRNVCPVCGNDTVTPDLDPGSSPAVRGMDSHLPGNDRDACLGWPKGH